MNLAPKTNNPASNLVLAAVVADQVAADLGLCLTVVDLKENLRVTLPEGTSDHIREVFVAHLAGHLIRGFTVSAFYRDLDVDGVITVTPWPASSEGWKMEAGDAEAEDDDLAGEDEADEGNGAVIETPKKRRGRPPGSKNKPTALETSE